MNNSVHEKFGLQERQSGFVIEGAGTVWCGQSEHDFRQNYDEAVRFARYVDADRVLHWMLREEYRRTCRIAEHVWIPPGANPMTENTEKQIAEELCAKRESGSLAVPL